MTFTLKPLLAGAALAAALSPMAQAQDLAQPRIAPRPQAAGQQQQMTQTTQRYRDHDRWERHGRHHDDDGKGWFFFGRHGHHDDDDARGNRNARSPAAPGAVAPPANGLFTQGGATPKAQVN
jgi:opacity protein-like surface antigen